MAASTCSGFPAAPAPPVAISAFSSLRKRGCFWPGFSFEVGSAFQAAAQILGACTHLPPCSVLEFSCPLSSQPHLALAPKRALTWRTQAQAQAPPVVPEAPVGMALFSGPAAGSLLPSSQGLTLLLPHCCQPCVLLSCCHMHGHRVATAVVIQPDFRGFPQLPVNRNPGQREDSCCCSSGRPWNEKCPPAAQPRVWLPDCLSFASRAGTVGALSSATA